MASLVEIILSAQDRTGPAFQSASTSLRVYGQTNDQTSARIETLSDRLVTQQRRLALHERQMRETAAAHTADSIAVERQAIRYDELTRSISRTERALDRLHTEQMQADITAIRPGAGGIGGIAGAAGAGGLASQLGIAQSALAGFGLALGTQEIIQYTIEAGTMANTLEATDLVIRQVAGSTERYSETVALARRNQELLGGSFQENLEAFSATLPLVQEYGIRLSTLNNLSLQLAQRRPSEAGQGAAFAISEFITSKGAEATLSLGDRFNLSRQRLLEIRNSGKSTEEQLAAVSQMLTEQGFGLDQLNERLNTTKNTYDRLGGALKDFKTTAGGVAAEAFRPLAAQLVALTQFASGDWKAAYKSFQQGGDMPVPFSGGQAAPAQPSARAALAPVIGPTAQPTARAALAPMVGPGTLPSARIAAPQQTTPAQPAPINQVNVTVHGSVVTETQLTDAIHRGLLTKQSQSGSLGFKR